MASADPFAPFVRVTMKPQWIRPAESFAQRLTRGQVEIRLQVLAAEAELMLRDNLNKWIAKNAPMR